MSDTTKQDAAPNSYELYSTDTQAEQNGQWVEMRTGLRYRIRSELSDAVRAYDTKLMKAQRAAYIANGGILPPKMQDRNDVLRCANAIVTGWEGQTDREGNLLPFTPANAERVLTDLPRLRNDVLTASRTEETFRVETQQLISGNSESTSPKNSA